MDIVLIGDCVANGQNLLLPKIANDPNLKVQDFNIQKSQEKNLLIWFLKNFKFKGKKEDILKQAYREKIKQEKLLAWPVFLKIEKNFAVSGETFQGMHYKIKNYLQEHKKPDLVLITDFSYSHRCVVINHNKQKFIVKRDIGWTEKPQQLYPLEVYNKFVTKVKKQELLGEKYQLRKNIKSFNILIKFLEHHNISYKFFVFHEKNKDISNNFVDCTRFEKRYKLIDGTTALQLKSKAQRHIADFVKKHI